MNKGLIACLTTIILIIVSPVTYAQSAKKPVDRQVFRPSPAKTYTGNPVNNPGSFDTLRAASQVQQLVRKTCHDSIFRVDEKMSFLEGKDKLLADSLHARPWATGDFDHNGLTDIMVMGWTYLNRIVCIIDSGNGKYTCKPIQRNLYPFNAFAIVIPGKDGDKVRGYYYKREYISDNKWDSGLVNKTLVYKFDDFILENLHPSTYNIRKIVYSADYCFGTCPVFKLSIDAGGAANWHAGDFNDIGGTRFYGDYHATIKKADLNKATSFLNYIGFEGLNNSYSQWGTDQPTSVIEITYDDGKMKKIRDYGQQGTYELYLLHRMMFDLRQNQEWSE